MRSTRVYVLFEDESVWGGWGQPMGVIDNEEAAIKWAALGGGRHYDTFTLNAVSDKGPLEDM